MGNHSPVETVATDATVAVELSVDLSTECPIVPEHDAYRVTVAWTTERATFEKWGLHDYLTSYSGEELTQEALCDEIYTDLRPAPVATLSVTVRDTKHMDMVVEKS